MSIGLIVNLLKELNKYIMQPSGEDNITLFHCYDFWNSPLQI